MEPHHLRVLLVDDIADDAELVTRVLARGGYAPRCQRVATLDALTAALRQPTRWDVILCGDSIAPQFGARGVIPSVHAAAPTVPILIVSGRYERELREELESGAAKGFVSRDHLEDLPAHVAFLMRQGRFASKRTTRQQQLGCGACNRESDDH